MSGSQAEIKLIYLRVQMEAYKRLGLVKWSANKLSS